VPDLSVSGDNSDLVEVDPHDPTTTSDPEAPMQSLNQLPMVTQSKNEQEKDASNLNITRGGVLNHRGQHVFVRVLG
jgi:hypothetical protein